MTTFFAGDYDVIVVGAGHAGCEAALACARLGLRTLIFTLHLDSVALLACNPSIGGTAKGHLVREVDALGGQMGLAADRAAIQRRMLNTGKGPAVHSLRAQEDKRAYHAAMRGALEKQERLHLKQGEVSRILVKSGKCSGVLLTSGAEYRASAVILCTGVYLRGRVVIGERAYASGPSGLFPANELTASLQELGLPLHRFKTGTPARVDGRTVDFSKMSMQPGEDVAPFSFMNKRESFEQIPCYLTYTNARTHKLITDNLHRAPLYSGSIQGVGPRYCPSIEIKVIRFAHHDRHPVFLEPEGRDTAEMYVQGMSTSLPEELQLPILRTIAGLERVEIMRPAYAIEYDCLDPTALTSDLMVRGIPGLLSAGQMNGSSGYEEAAGQGIYAGINAARYIKGDPPLLLTRSDAYIGVLVDDLVLRGTDEPYRMMTARAEHRLHLRQDNADLRLTELGRSVGLVDDDRYANFMRKKEGTERALNRIRAAVYPPGEALEHLMRVIGAKMPPQGLPAAQLLRRPEITYEQLADMPGYLPLTEDVREQVEISVKYEGYLAREQTQIDALKRQEAQKIPEDIDYDSITALRLEARQKLSELRPGTLGQAGRISGVSPADVSVLSVYLRRMRENQDG